MRAVHAQLAQHYAGDGLAAAFDWLTGCTPPLAAVVYIRGDPQNGLDTLAMCLAATFFKLSAADGSSA